jgi:hypothetical protein
MAYDFSVSALDDTNTSMLNTGIVVSQGQIVTITTSPAVRWSIGTNLWCTAGGSTIAIPPFKGFNAVAGALVGSLDGGGTFFGIGLFLQMSVVVSSPSKLSLCCWDGYYPDNSGSLTVNVLVSTLMKLNGG